MLFAMLLIWPENVTHERIMLKAKAFPFLETFFYLLQCMKNPLTQQRKSCPAKHHAFDKLSFVHLPLNNTIAVRQGETSEDGGFVSFDALFPMVAIQGSDSLSRSSANHQDVLL